MVSKVSEEGTVPEVELEDELVDEDTLLLDDEVIWLEDELELELD